MDLKKCISELLTAHDCVIIPGFGGFIGNYSPARIDPVHHTFSPPFKKLLFNINLVQNDGLLANHLSAEAGLSYPDACCRIDEMVEACRHDLKSGKPFIIPGVGRITMGREGNIQFEQDKTINLLPDAFGLTSFISPPVSINPYNAKLGKTIPFLVKQRTEKHIILPRPLKWAALIAIPVGVATIIGITQYDKFKTNPGNNAGILTSVFSRFSSASLVDKKEAPQTSSDPQLQMEPAPSVFDTPEEANLSMANEEFSDKDQVTESMATVEEPVQDIIAENTYAVIIGAFKIKENAENLVADLKLKDITATIFDRSRSGLYRVTIGTSNSRQEAEQLLEHTRSGEFHGAWLLEK